MDKLEKFTVCLLAAGAVFFSTTAGAGNGALLEVPIEFPRIESAFVAGQGASYDGTDLTIAGLPFVVNFTSGGTDAIVFGGSLTLTATIDSSGVLTGGSYSVTGSVTDPATSINYSGTLVSGSVLDYGIIDIGTTDLADFLLSVDSGSMKGLFDAVGSSAGAVVSLEGSTFAGSFAENWTASKAKPDIGPIPDGEPPPLPLTIGYWKNHPEAWPVPTLNICGVELSQQELLSILGTKPRGDKTIIMGRQLIAAKLNIANGNSCATLTDAEDWLCDHGGIGAGIKNWDGGEPLKDELDSFNNHDPDACM